MAPDKRVIFLGQFLIALMMAFLMTGIFTAIPSGFADGWVRMWMGRFVVAMPVAFGLSMLVGPFAFWLARKIVLLLPRQNACKP